MATQRTKVGHKIVVVGGDQASTRWLRRRLDAEHYRVLIAADQDAALSMIESAKPDLVILETASTLDLIKEAHEWSLVPFIVLSRVTSADVAIRAFQAGADDVILWPFNPDELVLRIEAICRRCKDRPSEPTPIIYRVGDLVLDAATHEVTIDFKKVSLSPIEYKLLLALVSNAGRVVAHSSLLNRVWGRSCCDNSDYLRTYIRYLRHKIEVDPSRPRIILTKLGVGYYIPDRDIAAAG